MNITLTDAAHKHIKETINTLSKSNGNILGVQFGVKKTGCSGYSYTIDFLYKDVRDINLENFSVFKNKDLDIYVSNDDLKFIEGMNVDYIQKGLGSVMVFDNPNAENECGCGESFSLKEKD